MESRLKERLTGAAILVALIVLLVPEMFHGQRTDVAATASSGEGPPVRSYTIDLSNSPARTAPLQSTPAAVKAESSDAASVPGTAAVVDKPAGNNAPASHGTSTSGGSAATAATPAAGAAGHAVASSATAASPGPAAHGAANARAGGAWSVQLGLFAQHDNAERLVHSAQGKGFAAVISERDAKGLYHVQVENLSDRAAAQAMQSRLHEQGLPAAVVAPAVKH